MNQLYRSSTDKVISGICGGIAEYFSVSSNIVRLLFIIISFITNIGLMFLAYIVATVLIPQAPIGHINYNHSGNYFSLESVKNKNLIGLALIALGVVLTLKRILRIDDVLVGSIILIAVGIYIIVKGGDKK